MREGSTFDAALPEAATDLPDADRRLAHELAAGVLRNRYALDDALTPLVRNPWDQVQDDLKDVLRLGAYQITHLRIPDYASVQSTVELAKQSVGAGPGGLVNAVLRRLAREPADVPVEPSEDLTAEILARRYSHPAWLVTRWLERFGRVPAIALLEHDNQPPAVTLRPARWDLDRLTAALDAAGVTHSPAPLDAGVRVRGVRIDQLPGYAEGGFVVQDPAQARVVEYIGGAPGARLWDACAAPGGKTVMLAGTTRVVAGDRDARRVRRLAQNVARAAPGTPLLVADAVRPPFGAVFDIVVVDAPCSATGTFAKHPDARWRLTPDALPRLVTLQGRILDGAAKTVRPGGLLVYITCSLEPEENGQQVDAFLSRDPGFARDADDLQVFPADAGTDGAYAARLRRSG